MDDPEVYFHVWNACVERPAEPVAPGEFQAADQSGVPRAVTVTRAEVSRLLVGGSGITRQPPSLNTRLDMPVIVYTDPSAQTLSTTVLGTPVTITATPKTYTWSWGDGTTTQTIDPGHPYPDHTVFHYYRAPAQGLRVTLTTTWSATYTAPEGTTRPVVGTIITTNTTTPFNVKDYTAVLTDETEEKQGR
ncbi:zinc transporter [Actinomyces trachealis]|uniref:zinc transporter n=1 Tax=Actinomyces trachealis TaxID=2763540 RepID=UPI001F447710|nr:zinc transporter [Actinomyces trachealis]